MSLLCSSMTGVEVARMNAIVESLGDVEELILELMMILITFPVEVKKGGCIKQN